MNASAFYITSSIFFALFFFLIPKLCYPQNDQQPAKRVTLTGRIADEASKPLFATVTVKGTHLATGTNEKGEFALKDVDADAILIISGVGIVTTEVDVSGRANIGIITVKAKIIETDEVIVEANTGYQILQPNEIAGSIVTIDNKTFNEQVGTNVLDRLNGVTSGLLFNNKLNSGRPNTELNITIRGLSTINGALDPLIVLDNFIYEGDINNINPNDIESVSVLKDAAATSIYGARGGNGVIVLTSKMGKINQPIRVDFNSSVIVRDKPNLFYLPQISSSDYIDVEQFLYRNGYYADDINFDWYYHKPFTPALQVFIAKQNGLISESDSMNQINRLKTIDSRKEYQKYFYTNAVTQQYAINVRGGSKSNAYLFSVNYDRNRGTLYEQSNKLNIHVQNIYKPHKKVQVLLGAYYTNSLNRSGRPSSAIWNLTKSVPYIQLMNDNSTAASVPRSYADNYTDTLAGGNLLDWKFYPLEDYKHYQLSAAIEEIVADIGLRYEIIKGLDIDLKYQYQRQNTNSENMADMESFYTRDLINRFSVIDYANGAVTSPIPEGDIQMRFSNTINSKNFRAQLNYRKKWNMHAVNAMAGFEVRERDEDEYSSTIYGYHADPLTVKNVDLVNQYPTLPYGSLGNIPGAPYVIGKINRFVALYANMVYLFRDKYSLYASARKDGANIFGLATNDKWKPLWSTGVGWDVSKESFYKSDVITHLKLRTTFGYSGNVDASRSALPIASYSTYRLTNLPYTRISTISNPQLKWEETMQFNFAVDFQVGRGIINGTVEFYKKDGRNLYAPTPYDYTTWGRSSQITKNVANVAGKGLDISLQSKNVDRIFKWTTQLLLNYNRSKVTRYFSPESLSGANFVGSAGTTIQPVVGMPMYYLAAYKWAGLNEQGQPQGFLDGEVSTDYQKMISYSRKQGIHDNENIVMIGSATPVIFGSVINTFAWKNFTASINLSYKAGYYFKKTPWTYAGLFSNGVAGDDFTERWQKPGDEKFTNIPAMVYINYPQFSNREQFYLNSEIHYYKADHVRLQYLNVSYTIKDLGKSLNTRIRIYANIANLGILWRANSEKIDPDFPSAIPAPTSYAIGLQANF